MDGKDIVINGCNSEVKRYDKMQAMVTFLFRSIVRLANTCERLRYKCSIGVMCNVSSVNTFGAG